MDVMPTTLESLLAAYDADSSDAVTASALADFYEESGEQSAADAVRWLARNGKRPLPHRSRSGFRNYLDGLNAMPTDVAWVSAAANFEITIFVGDVWTGVLPVRLWDALTDYIQRCNPGWYKTYRSPSLALLAFVNAWRGAGVAGE